MGLLERSLPNANAIFHDTPKTEGNIKFVWNPADPMLLFLLKKKNIQVVKTG